MIKNTTVNSVVDVPAQHLWATIAQGGGVDKWFGAVITSCELKGNWSTPILESMLKVNLFAIGRHE